MEDLAVGGVLPIGSGRSFHRHLKNLVIVGAHLILFYEILVAKVTVKGLGGRLLGGICSRAGSFFVLLLDFVNLIDKF